MEINSNVIIGYISAIVLFLGTPGPVTVMVANASSKYGFKAGFGTVIGTNLASLILIAISFAVLMGAFMVSESALLWITLFGSLYLMYFAYEILMEPAFNADSDVSSDTESSSELNTETEEVIIEDNHIVKSHFKHGFIIGISNPKDILFFIGFFPMFFQVTSDRTISMLVLVGIWIVLDYSILSAYSLAFSKITNYKHVNIISKLAGLILMLVALFALYKTAQALFF